MMKYLLQKNLPAFVWIDGVRHMLSLAPVILGVRCIFLSVILYSSLLRGTQLLDD